VIAVTVPKPLKVVSNGLLSETLDRGDKRTFVYRPRDPIATYLVTIAIAEFEETEVAGPPGLSIHNYFSPQTRADARDGFDSTGSVIRFLTDTFGDYPFETCGNILSSLDLPGALETQTLPTFGFSAGDESTICHEQAHQWFGNCVSVKSWQDVWLNEGFAEYASWMYLEATQGREVFDKHVLRQYAFYRSVKRSSLAGGDTSASDARGSFPPPPGRPTARSMFGSAIYVRGPLALDALRSEVGDSSFLALMRSWIRIHKNGNVSVADFLTHVEQAASPKARSIVERWILDDEMPHVAAWDEQLAKEKAERDAKRREREEQNSKKQESGESRDGLKKKDR
jgi:aminopeptidase N